MDLEPRDVVYLALGGRRVRAAAAHTAELAASGTRVALVAAARREWDGVDLDPAVTVHRVPGRDAARRMLLDGPLRATRLLIAGDPEALAVAWSVRRRRPELTVRLEPSPHPGRRPAPADLAVVTPWYPSPDDAYAGAFVRATAGAVTPAAGRVAILHTQCWFYPPGRLAGQRLAVAAERQAARSGPAVVLDTAEGELTRVAVPAPAGEPYTVYAHAQTEALRAVLPTGRIEAPVVHAHTGMMGGVVATRLARPDARVVVTEHASFLPRVFAQPGGREAYARMLARVDVLLCVGGYLYDQLRGYFPEYEAKLRVVPNVVDFDRFATRPAPPSEPLRWLYVGRLVARKGVRTLLDGFARIAAEDPRVTLTLAGSGPLAGELARRVTELGLAERVDLRPPVPPDGVPDLLRAHDLLVHASTMETFGMTVVEAVATGTPVLVARSAGPAETLAGIADAAGALFEPTDDPEVLAEAYRKLRARFDELDLAAARADLRRRYGREAVAARLLEIYAGPATARRPDEPVRAPLPRRLAARMPGTWPEVVVRTAGRVYRRVLVRRS